MINAISMLNLGKLSNVQQLAQANSKTVSTPAEEKTLMPKTNNTHINVQDMAALIKQVNQSNAATTNQEVAKNSDVDRMAKVYIENAKRFLNEQKKYIVNYISFVNNWFQLHLQKSKTQHF